MEEAILSTLLKRVFLNCFGLGYSSPFIFSMPPDPRVTTERTFLPSIPVSSYEILSNLDHPYLTSSILSFSYNFFLMGVTVNFNF